MGTVFSGLSALVIEGVDDAGDVIVVRARTRDAPAACPGCGEVTARVHGYHVRTVADVPADGRRVQVRARVRRMRCPGLDCAVQTFREQVPGVLDRYQRRTSRLAWEPAELGFPPTVQAGGHAWSGQPVSWLGLCCGGVTCKGGWLRAGWECLFQQAPREAPPRTAEFCGFCRTELTAGSSSGYRTLPGVTGMGRAASLTASAAEMVAGHVTLDISCIDRLYLNGNVPDLQTPGCVIYFFREHRKNPIVSPSLFEPIGAKFRKGLKDWA